MQPLAEKRKGRSIQMMKDKENANHSSPCDGQNQYARDTCGPWEAQACRPPLTSPASYIRLCLPPPPSPSPLPPNHSLLEMCLHL